MVFLRFALIVVMSVCVGCPSGSTSGKYAIAIDFDLVASPTLNTDTQRIDLYLLDDCDLPLGEVPSKSSFHTQISNSDAEPALSNVAPGTYGMYAYGVDDGCNIIAAGCNDVTLIKGGSGSLAVTLTRLATPAGRDCEAGTSCSDALCVQAKLACDGVDEGDACTGEEVKRLRQEVRELREEISHLHPWSCLKLADSVGMRCTPVV